MLSAETWGESWDLGPGEREEVKLLPAQPSLHCPLSPTELTPVKIKLRSARIVRSKSQQEHFVFIILDALGNGLRDESIISELRRGLHLTDTSFETLKTHHYAQCLAMLWV